MDQPPRAWISSAVDFAFASESRPLSVVSLIPPSSSSTSLRDNKPIWNAAQLYDQRLGSVPRVDTPPPTPPDKGLRHPVVRIVNVVPTPAASDESVENSTDVGISYSELPFAQANGIAKQSWSDESHRITLMKKPRWKFWKTRSVTD